MLIAIRGMISELQKLNKELRPQKNKQIFSSIRKKQAKDIVEHYFRDIRDQLLLEGLENLSNVDVPMQQLLEATQKNSAASTYRKNVSQIIDGLHSLEKQSLVSRADARTDPIDRLIISTLSKLLPAAARSYEQAVIDLRTAERLSWRGPATDLRESLRETLDHLAPDKAVIEEKGFKLERDCNGPTMKQKVRFILGKRGVGKSRMEAPENATAAVDEIVGRFVRSVYTRSNVSTHTPTERNEVARIRDWVRVAFCEMLELQTGE